MKKYLLYISVFALLFSCTQKTEVEEKEKVKSDVVKLTSDEVVKHNIKTVKASVQKLNEFVKARGSVELPPDHVFKVSVPFAGKVGQVNKLPGDFVKAGETLLTVESLEILNLQQEYLNVKNELEFLEKEYNRQKKLAEVNVSAKKVLEKTTSEYSQKKAQEKTLKEKLKLAGLNADNLNNNNIFNQYTVVAQKNGYISDFDITNGTYVNPENVLMEILDYNHLHLEIYVFEKDISRIDTGQKVFFKVARSDKDALEAKVIQIGRSINEANKTFTVHCHLKEMYPFLRHGMKLSANIVTSSQEVLTLPNTAVVRDEDDYFVYEMIGENTYARKKIEVESWEDNYFILKNSDFENKEFVQDNVFYLESRR
jgi:cobalt-zinc-cadmium efflux system membrane fusion protein